MTERLNWTPWKKINDKPKQLIKSRDITFLTGPNSQTYGFSSSNVQIWELDHKEGWAPKNWGCQTVVLEKILKSLLDCKEIRSISPKGNQPWIFIGRIDAEAPILWLLDVKSDSLEKTLMLGNTEGKRRRRQQRMRWLDGITDSVDKSEQTPRDSEGEGSLACCCSWGHKELDTT